MTGSSRLAEAQVDARVARTRLIASLLLLKARLSPGMIVREAKETVVAKGTEVAKDGVDAVIAHKWSVAGAASLIGLFLARKPIAAMLSDDDETSASQTRLKEDFAKSVKDKK